MGDMTEDTIERVEDEWAREHEEWQMEQERQLMNEANYQFNQPMNEEIQTKPLVQTEETHPILSLHASPTLGKIGLAMSKAQIRIRGAVKDSSNPYFKSSYADLASVWDACHEAINENEIGIFQLPSTEGNKVTVVTLLVHSSGEWLMSELSMTAKQGDPQAIGSLITYCRRYALGAMAGVCPVDDDGEAAMGRTEKAKKDDSGISKKAQEAAHKKNVEDAKKACEKATPEEKKTMAERMTKAGCTPEEVAYATGNK